MIKKISFLIFLLFLLVTPLIAEGQQEGGGDTSVEEWEKYAGLGAYTPENEDINDVIAKAKEEGNVVIYSLSSRVFEFGRTFYKKYGIRIEASDLPTPNIQEKVRLEQNAGVYNMDVVLVDDVPTIINEFVKEGLIYKYVPADLKDSLTDEAKNSPLLIHHYGARGIMYNNKEYKKPPVDSWWDITRPEWKGRLMMKDPMRSGAEFNTFATFVQKADDFAKAYKEEFGEEIELKGTQNAGYEFIKRMLDNELVLHMGSSTIPPAINDSPKNSPLGLLSFSKLRTVADENLNIDVVRKLKPVTVFRTTTVMGIGRKAKHPYAAKLLIHWMLGGSTPKEERMGGYKPYHVIGNWSVRTDIDEPAGQPTFEELGYYVEDVDWLYNNSIYVRDFWLQKQ